MHHVRRKRRRGATLVEGAIVLATDENLSLDLFPHHVRGLAPVRVARAKVRGLDTLCTEMVSMGLSDPQTPAGQLYDRVVKLVEKELISQVLRVCQGTQTKAALKLGINRNTLHKKIEDYGLASEVR